MSSQVMDSVADTRGTRSTSTVNTTSNLASELKPRGSTAEKVKPCCVCKDEKALRDECMLFSTADDAQEDCKKLVGAYRSCMAGYGFKI